VTEFVADLRKSVIHMVVAEVAAHFHKAGFDKNVAAASSDREPFQSCPVVLEDTLGSLAVVVENQAVSSGVDAEQNQLVSSAAVVDNRVEPLEVAAGIQAVALEGFGS